MESGTCDEALIAGAAACRVVGIPRHACIAIAGAAAARGLDVEEEQMEEWIGIQRGGGRGMKFNEMTQGRGRGWQSDESMGRCWRLRTDWSWSVWVGEGGCACDKKSLKVERGVILL